MTHVPRAYQLRFLAGADTICRTSDLARIVAEHAYCHGEEVVTAITRFRAALAPYGGNFEELAGPAPYSQVQTKLWRAMFDALKGGRIKSEFADSEFGPSRDGAYRRGFLTVGRSPAGFPGEPLPGVLLDALHKRLKPRTTTVTIVTANPAINPKVSSCGNPHNVGPPEVPRLFPGASVTLTDTEERFDRFRASVTMTAIE